MKTGIQKLDFSPLGVRSLNQKLAQILTAAPDLQIRSIRFKPVLIHFDGGAYPTGLSHDWHAHSEIQFQIGITGCFDIGTRTARQILKPGHAWLIGPGVEHYWKCRQSGVLMGVHIQIAGPATQQISRMIEEVWANRLLALPPQSHLVPLEDLLMTIDRGGLWWIDRAAMSFKTWVMGLLENTLPLHQFYRTLPLKDSGPDDQGKRYCQLAVDYLQYNLHRKIRLAEVASHLGISVRHLNRLFKTHIKTTCNEWLIEERMQKARALMLATPTLPIKTIAYHCGFAKPAYFSKVYKDHWGSPPSQSR